ncbi:hypothetical protein LENED_010276 [Lentinula edodes]|uniref:Uncharacterized protein n=1 Tax=Lentinula edodes TaxID=5353 RepID=A0A1Q3EM00_LENED|nr:hypothetical protein LENED_010276 [Lentinula edodes]
MKLRLHLLNYSLHFGKMTWVSPHAMTTPLNIEILPQIIHNSARYCPAIIPFNNVANLISTVHSFIRL